MCKIRIHNEIMNEQDVQNLITAIILRQRGLFTRKYLLDATKYFLPDSSIRVIVNDQQVSGMIDKTLSSFSKTGSVKIKDGYYYPSRIDFKLATKA